MESSETAPWQAVVYHLPLDRHLPCLLFQIFFDKKRALPDGQ